MIKGEMMEIYFYANKKDLEMIFDESIDDVWFLSSTFQKYDVIFTDGKFCFESSDNAISEKGITFYPCWMSRNYLQPGCLYLDNQKDNIADKKILFSKIKKIIRNIFILSKDKSYYIGPSIYLDWLNRKYRFPCLLSYDSFEVDAKHVDLEFLFDDIQTKEFVVRSQKCYLINEEYIVRDTDHYVIFNDMSNMEFAITDDVKHYEYGSECVHIVGKKEAGRKIYSFIIDKRLSNCETNTMTQLYKKLKLRYFVE